MKKIIIKKIDIGSVAKPLFIIALVISIVLGLGLALFMIPTTTIETLSEDGVIISETVNRVPGAASAMFGVIVAMFANVMGIYVLFIIGLILFNIFCRYTGGIGVHVELPEKSIDYESVRS